MTTQAGRTLTFGDYRVRRDFSPSDNPTVDDIKRRAAHRIDAISAIGGEDDASEFPQFKAPVMIDIEAGALWAAKAAARSSVV